MRYGYTMLANGLGGNWGECLLLDQVVGEVVLGKKHAKDLPKDLLDFLLSNVESIEVLETEIFNTNDYSSDSYYTLVNSIYDKKSSYILKFDNIAALSNYIRDQNIIILDNLFY